MSISKTPRFYMALTASTWHVKTVLNFSKLSSLKNNYHPKPTWHKVKSFSHMMWCFSRCSQRWFGLQDLSKKRFGAKPHSNRTRQWNIALTVRHKTEVNSTLSTQLSCLMLETTQGGVNYDITFMCGSPIPTRINQIKYQNKIKHHDHPPNSSHSWAFHQVSDVAGCRCLD